MFLPQMVELQSEEKVDFGTRAILAITTPNAGREILSECECRAIAIIYTLFQACSYYSLKL